jgi:hypothetical protein
MAMTKVATSANDSWNGKDSNLKENDELHGFFIGKKENVGKFNATIYIIEDKEDKKLDVWGSTVLDSAFDQIKLGAEVKITFIGTQDTGKGNPVKLYDVEADNDFAYENKESAE